MKKSLVSLASIAAVAASLGVDRFARPAEPTIYRRKVQRVHTDGQLPRYQPVRRGKRYPEQSSRQEMRGFRRAQGGPGIELIGGIYHIAIPGCNF